MITTAEYKWVDRLGDAIRKRLKYQVDRRFQITDETVTETDYTAGISSRIGYLGSPSGVVELYAILDGFAAHPRPLPWIGMFIPGRNPTLRVHEHLERHDWSPRVVKDSAMVVRDGISRMKKPLEATDLGTPRTELYGGQHEKGIGAYFKAPRSFAARPTEKFIEAATDFVHELIVAVTAQDQTTLAGAPQSVVLKRAIVSTSAVARNAKQAKEAKRRDRYTCRLCGTKPEDVYGAAGHACLEAHHLDEVGGRNRTRADLNRVITLCANCHRVVHGLPATQRQLSSLQKRFARTAKTGTTMAE